MQERTGRYKERVSNYTAQQKKINAQLSLISFIRLMVFLIFAWWIYSAFRERFHNNDLLYAVLTIPVFLFLLYLSKQRKATIGFLRQMVSINQNEIDVADGKLSFLSNGQSPIPQKNFTADLDLFGPGSLFHVLNRAGSKPGREQLSKQLSQPFIDPQQILAYQSATKELAAKLEFRQVLLAHTLQLEEEEALPQLRAGIPLKEFEGLDKGIWPVLSWLWPAIGLITTVYAVITNRYQWMLPIGILGFFFLSFAFRRINLLYNSISKRSYLYNQYAQCFRLIGAQVFEDPYLQEKQKHIEEAAAAFEKLSRLTGLFDLRMSVLSLFLNGLFLFDLLCSRAYLTWNRRYQQNMPGWFDTLGQIELLNSLASFADNHPDFIFPTPINNSLEIAAEAMGHPLMNAHTAVTNDIAIGRDARLHIITGSNMSGKSTFLRTLGLNMVLAQCGAPVFAKSFVFRPVQFLTSFHHIDSLSESTSYFYAELKALQQIIGSLSEPVPSLVLLDEVMRGTNSKDKHDGTALLIKKILTFDCLTLIATHDTELGILENSYPGQVRNFCFESELSDKGLVFDFTKRKGVAQSTNATYLMQQMGII